MSRTPVHCEWPSLAHSRFFNLLSRAPRQRFLQPRRHWSLFHKVDPYFFRRQHNPLTVSRIWLTIHVQRAHFHPAGFNTVFIHKTSAFSRHPKAWCPGKNRQIDLPRSNRLLFSTKWIEQLVLCEGAVHYRCFYLRTAQYYS